MSSSSRNKGNLYDVHVNEVYVTRIRVNGGKCLARLKAVEYVDSIAEKHGAALLVRGVTVRLVDAKRLNGVTVRNEVVATDSN